MGEQKEKDKNVQNMIVYEILGIIITILIFWGLQYAGCTAINLMDREFLTLVQIVLLLGFFITAMIVIGFVAKGKEPKMGLLTIYLLVVVLFTIFNICVSIFSSKIMNASLYANRIDVIESDFEEDIPEINDLNKIPLMDTTTAATIGRRAIGELSSVVSQYKLNSDEYTTIIYNDKVIKVTPLEYDGIFKWINNKANGIPGYIIIDTETNESTYVQTETPIKYSLGTYFGNNVVRYARKLYPDKIFGNCSFQIDDDGNPMWTIMTKKNKLMCGVSVPDGLIVVDACTGDANWYEMEEIPEWVDCAIDGDTALELYNSYGLLSNGFLNSVFAQTNCTQATNDFGYIAIDNDIYYYTGVTSVVNDSSNIGFLLINSRTGEFKFYDSPGADESSAMRAAQGALQNYGYVASFPSLIKYNGEPVYAMALKDASGLVKAYAFVNEQNYTVIGTGSTLNEALNSYQSNANKSGYDIQEFSDSIEIVSDTVESINYIVSDGVTYTYIKTSIGKAYKQIFSESHILIDVGDEVTIEYNIINEDNEIISATFYK